MIDSNELVRLKVDRQRFFEFICLVNKRSKATHASNKGYIKVHSSVLEHTIRCCRRDLE